MSIEIPRKLRWLVAGLTLLGTAAPSLAQPLGDQDITISGRYRTAPDWVQSLSARVPYHDLDLRTASGRQVLRQRVADTGAALCDRLGESDDNFGPIPSCQRAAWDDAQPQIRYAEASYRPVHRGYASASRWQPASYAYAAPANNYPRCTARRHDRCVQ
jgi:UrcA family protein